MTIYTADLCDEHGDTIKVAEPIFTQYGKRRSFSGMIYTVKVFEDNVLVKKALQTIPKGSVLIVDGGGSRSCALVGDNLADLAIKREIAGIVVNGCIRDTAQINEMDIGIFALGSHPLKSKKQGKGQEHVDVYFAGVSFQPESYLYADEDGIVLSNLKK
ncbi:ribonuclease E activity regulator RraA [Alkalihalobacillus sp. MEB130]|uniref:ribonuclease E activity regulator RraA n=1 Tax=Alkalihalobacillus sp. MEB130 TaxID=2976704 RepID=UPI0028DFE680|nr:ribonuclease E activity regulator RraA [Alkalihalobacillus sp. MEB130]MDT8861266.1 ribonuclease E activity regulator RraA [Alkalihalobacillus sp. MEB130]